jgi:hypothetical protein
MALVGVTALKDFRTNGLSTSDVSTGVQLGPLTATQKLYAGLALTAASLGTTARMLLMSIQAASSSGFGAASTPTQFALSTAQGAEWGVPVPVSTDLPWFRASWTLSTGSSTGGSWKGIVFAGIK